MADSDEQKLWAYYTAAAKKLGLKRLENGKDGQEQAYSVRWYYDDHSPEKNILTRAFLGDGEAMGLVRRAILGQASPAELDRLYDRRGSARYDENDFLEGSPQPDEAQKDAIRAALTMPISFIKGPPGTGKTSGILHLLSCIHRQGMTAAMVSSNNTAIQAVTNKLDSYTDSAEPKKYALHNAFARLGNSKRREEFEQAHPDPELFDGKHKTCSATPSERFLAKRPIIASTIHSLPRCFADWRKTGREPVYDYVIVDESSQVNALLGLMAMGGARHLVLVGDDDQLPPVTDEKRIRQGTVHEEEDAADIQGFESIYALRAERSFLEVCREVFLGDDDELDKMCSKMLRFHYRCHPGIISFCRQEVYNSGREKLEIRTRQYDMTHPTPIRVVWFEGTFCEKIKAPGKDRFSKCNRRQSEIFMQEEWPDLLDRLCADPCSVLWVDREGHRPFRFGVLSPFKGQLWDLRDRLSQWLADTDNRKMIREKANAHRPALLALLEDVGVEAYLAQNEELADKVRKTTDGSAEAIADLCIHDFPDRLRPLILGEDSQAEPMEVILPELTVHKAQGQEYDVVYFLPSDDDMWEWPWSQKKRLINVAVSRAKRELRIIASTALMDEDIQRSLTGSDERVVSFQPSAGDGGSEDDAFLRKLIRYVWERGPGGPGPWTDGPFGFHRASSHSMFERAAAVEQRRILPDGKKAYPSAPEVCFQDWLSRLPLVVDNGLRVYVNAPISAIKPGPALADQPQKVRKPLEKYIGHGAHFDCVICQGERVLMAIEVDGVHHRIKIKGKINKCKINDAKKNRIVALGFGAAMYVARGGGCVPMEGSAPDGSGGFTFLRLPTDGTARDEDKTVEKLLAERLGTESGPVYTLSVSALADLPENRWWYVFQKLSQVQDWNTGRPVEEKRKGVDARRVPLEIGTRRGLIMSYLPDDAKNARRLCPGMVCQADAWERLSVKADQRKKG